MPITEARQFFSRHGKRILNAACRFLCPVTNQIRRFWGAGVSRFPFGAILFQVYSPLPLKLFCYVLLCNVLLCRGVTKRFIHNLFTLFEGDISHNKHVTVTLL